MTKIMPPYVLEGFRCGPASLVNLLKCAISFLYACCCEGTISYHLLQHRHEGHLGDCSSATISHRSANPNKCTQSHLGHFQTHSGGHFQTQSSLGSIFTARDIILGLQKPRVIPNTRKVIFKHTGKPRGSFSNTSIISAGRDSIFTTLKKAFFDMKTMW